MTEDSQNTTTAQGKGTEELIADLSADLRPVKCVLRPAARITPWLVIVGAYMVGVVHFLGLRMDWRDKLHDKTFDYEMILACVLCVFSAYAAGWLTVPDMRGRQWILSVPVTLLGAFMLLIVCQAVSEGAAFPALSWHHCFSDALLMGFVPIASLSVLVQGGATTRPLWMAGMSVLAVGAAGWIAQRMTCPADTVGHTMLFHFLPLVLLACVIGALARRLYRW